MSVSEPLAVARIGPLFLSFAFSVIGCSVGLNAYVKSNQERSYIRHVASLGGASVTIDANDVLSAGAVITVVCALLALLSATSFAFTWCPIQNKRFWYRSQSCALFFCSIWLFATLIPFDYFFANREAQVTATLGGVTVSDITLKHVERVLGVTPVYRDLDYLKLVAILPWFALVFSVTAGVVLHISARREGAPVDRDDAPPGVSTTEHGEKSKKIETEGQA
ncbi:hypothetical protein PAXINDRAFT_99095 [Paxillus involutus ATCC 200175]|nr:hypothetical protein PAXINDRAFT_99095 [Paxillus involutus ATCC 200175]